MLYVEHIHLFYGASHALRGVSLAVEKGQVTCLLGRNGVGKSSTLKAIIGLERLESGNIMFLGEQLTTMAPARRAEMGLAYVPQGREIFPILTVEENLKTGFACNPRTERFIQDEIFELFPVLKDMLRRRGGDLSGGQQQQLAIARALVTRPKLLVLDEPTEGIQPSIIKDIGRVIQTLAARGDMGILLVEQYFDFAYELADTWYVMERGEILQSGRRGSMDETKLRAMLAV